jgi:hypothetical protein
MGRRSAVRSAVVIALASCVVLLIPTACASRASSDALTQLRATPGWGTRARTLLEEAEEEAELEGDDPEDEQNMEDEAEDAEADDGVEVRPAGTHVEHWRATPRTLPISNHPRTTPHQPGAAVHTECIRSCSPGSSRLLGDNARACCIRLLGVDPSR